MPWIIGLRIPAVLLRGIPGQALRAFPGSFRNFSGISSGKSQPYWGYGPENAGTKPRKPINLADPSRTWLHEEKHTESRFVISFWGGAYPNVIAMDLL